MNRGGGRADSVDERKLELHAHTSHAAASKIRPYMDLMQVTAAATRASLIGP